MGMLIIIYHPLIIVIYSMSILSADVCVRWCVCLPSSLSEPQSPAFYLLANLTISFQLWQGVLL